GPECNRWPNPPIYWQYNCYLCESRAGHYDYRKKAYGCGEAKDPKPESPGYRSGKYCQALRNKFQCRIQQHKTGEQEAREVEFGTIAKATFALEQVMLVVP